MASTARDRPEKLYPSVHKICLVAALATLSFVWLASKGLGQGLDLKLMMPALFLRGMGQSILHGVTCLTAIRLPTGAERKTGSHLERTG